MDQVTSTMYGQNGDNNLSQMMRLLEDVQPFTFVECLVAESAPNASV